MASFHLAVHPNVSRGKGQSLVRTAAYNARARLVDAQTNEVWDYQRKGGLLAEMIYAPKDAPEWSRDLMRLVNEIERVEKRSDAQLAMNLDIALPHELTLEQNKRLIGDFVREEFMRQGYVSHIAIHAPDREGDQRNIHAHVLVSLRTIGPEGFARTKAEQQDRYRNRGEFVEHLREKWERLGNRHLERAGHAPTLDRRSLRDRGIEDREAEQHRGPTVTAMERDERPTRVGDEINSRRDKWAELRSLQREERQIDAEIIDLQAKRAEREAQRGQQRQEEIGAGETRAGEGRASHGPENARTNQPEGNARFDPTTAAPASELSPQEANTEVRQQYRAAIAAAYAADRENATARRVANDEAREARQELRQTVHTAERAAETAVELPGEAVEKGIDTGLKILGGIARLMEGAIGFLGGLFGGGGPRMTAQQAEQHSRAAEERGQQSADLAAYQEKESARDAVNEARDREQTERRAAPEYFRHITRGEADRDEGRERERER